MNGLASLHRDQHFFCDSLTLMMRKGGTGGRVNGNLRTRDVIRVGPEGQCESPMLFPLLATEMEEMEKALSHRSSEPVPPRRASARIPHKDERRQPGWEL